MRGVMVLLAAALLAAAGCERGPDVVPVSGQITLDGEPLAGARINTQPIGTMENPNPGQGSFGETDQEGRYTLELVTEDEPGAVVGEHRVTIVMKEDAFSPDPTDDRYRPPTHRMPRHFTDGSLRITVPAGGSDEADLHLTTKAP